MPDTLTLSLILPVHNQADHIEPIVASYCDALRRRLADSAFELILVTNACRDNSPKVCANLSQKFPEVRTIDTPVGGWGGAVRLGLAQARGQLICYTNSARTSSEVLIDAISLGLANPGHVIKANRKIRESWRRRLGSLLYNLECRAFFDLPTWDINGTPKVFPRKCSHLLKLSRQDDLIDCEFNAICRAQGYPILELPVVQTQRHGGKSTTNYKSALKMYWGAFQLWRSMRQQTSA